MLYTACQERAGSCASGRSSLRSHGHTAQLGPCLHRTDIVSYSPATPSFLQPGMRLHTGQLCKKQQGCGHMQAGSPVCTLLEVFARTGSGDPDCGPVATVEAQATSNGLGLLADGLLRALPT